MRLNSKYITALDVQDRYVLCVQIRYSSGSWDIYKTSRKEIPPPENDENSSHYAQTAHAIKSLLQTMDIYPPKNLVTSISGRDAAVKLLSLPPVSDKNLKDVEGMVRYELMMHLPVNVEQMGYDYKIVERSDDETKILTAAAKRNVLNRHLKLLALAGVRPDVVTTSCLTLFNAFAGKEPESIESGRVALVCLRDSSGDVVVCEDGNLTYARSFTFQAGGDKEQLVREIHNSFDTYSKSRGSENTDVESICLMTEDGQLPSYLTEDDLSRIAPTSQWKMYSTGDDLAFGLALAGARFDFRSTSPSPFRINLLRQIAQERRAVERKAIWDRLGQMAPAIAAVVLLAISALLWWQVNRAEGELRSLEDARQSNKQRISRISQLNETEENLQERIASLDWAASGYPMVSYRLYEIAQTMPGDLWLKEVYIPEKQTSSKKKKNEQPPISKLYVVGYAQEQHQIEGFLSDLRKCDCFSDVKQESTSEVRLAGERILEFKIGLISDPRRLVKASLDI